MSGFNVSKQLQNLLENLQEALPQVLVYPSDQAPSKMHQCIRYSMSEPSKRLIRLHVRAASDEAMDEMIKGVYRALPKQLADGVDQIRDPDVRQEILGGYQEWIMEIHF